MNNNSSREKREFREKIEVNLNQLGREQAIYFTWLCAVRALPFIGASGHFNYWKGDIQQYLYTIFRTLDAIIYYRSGDDDSKTVRTAAAIATAEIAAKATIHADVCERLAADAASRYENNYRDDYAFSDAITYPSYAKAAYSAACVSAACACAAEARIAYEVIACAWVAADPKDNTATRAARAADIFNIDLKTTILEDMRIIRYNGMATPWTKEVTFKSKLDLYGNIWDNFLKALADEGCSYWGHLYKNIFERSFKMNKNELEQRMTVPKEIQEQGASAVSHYLEIKKDKNASA